MDFFLRKSCISSVAARVPSPVQGRLVSTEGPEQVGWQAVIRSNEFVSKRGANKAHVSKWPSGYIRTYGSHGHFTFGSGPEGPEFAGIRKPFHVCIADYRVSRSTIHHLGVSTAETSWKSTVV